MKNNKDTNDQLIEIDSQDTNNGESISMEVDKVENKDNKKDEQLSETNERQDLLTDEELAALKEQLKSQILNELKDEHTRKLEEAKRRREEEKKKHDEYIQKMKESPEPWVDIVGWVRTPSGVEVELEWNDAFVDFLRSEGITGVDEDEVVKKWVILLMHDMADKMQEELGQTFI